MKQSDKEIVQTMNDTTGNLEIAENAGLLTEVVVWALIAMKDNPTLSISDAVVAGMIEWDVQ